MSEIQVFDDKSIHYVNHMVPLVKGNYPDGAPYFKQIGDLGKRLGGLLLRPSNVENFMAAMWLADAAEEHGTPFSTLVLPFVPAARQDRINEGYNSDYLFTLKSVAREINMRNFEKVVVLDPHSDVAPALIDRCETVDLYSLFSKNIAWSADFLGRYDGVIAPDAGAAKRAEKVAKVLGVPVIQATKKRDASTGKLSGFAVDLPRENNEYLVVDDICDGGGTFVGLHDAALISSRGAATLDLFVTHGVFSKGTEPLMTRYRKVYTTDSTTFDKGSAIVMNAVSHLLNR